MQTVEEIYQQYIKPLADDEKMRLIAQVSGEMVEASASKGKRSLLELEGLGAEVWSGTDVQKYVEDLRNEWEHRP